MRWVEEHGLRWLEAELPGARAAFTTRRGGVSAAPFDSLNFGFTPPDSEGAVLENRSRLAGALKANVDDFLCAHQVHGVGYLDHQRRQANPPFAAATRGESAPQADAQISSLPGTFPLVYVADCLPIALATGPRGASPGRIAMLHCGWRPLAGGLIERVVAEVGSGAAAIGPGIGPCCYEVGDEVRGAFEHLDQPGSPVAAGRHLDLSEAAERLLRRAGIEHVERADLCTSCNEKLFFSHRRDRGTTGRQVGVVWFD